MGVEGLEVDVLLFSLGDDSISISAPARCAICPIFHGFAAITSLLSARNHYKARTVVRSQDLRATTAPFVCFAVEGSSGAGIPMNQVGRHGIPNTFAA